MSFLWEGAKAVGNLAKDVVDDTVNDVKQVGEGVMTGDFKKVAYHGAMLAPMGKGLKAAKYGAKGVQMMTKGTKYANKANKAYKYTNKAQKAVNKGVKASKKAHEYFEQKNSTPPAKGFYDCKVLYEGYLVIGTYIVGVNSGGYVEYKAPETKFSVERGSNGTYHEWVRVANGKWKGYFLGLWKVGDKQRLAVTQWNDCSYFATLKNCSFKWQGNLVDRGDSGEDIEIKPCADPPGPKYKTCHVMDTGYVTLGGYKLGLDDGGYLKWKAKDTAFFVEISKHENGTLYKWAKVAEGKWKGYYLANFKHNNGKTYLAVTKWKDCCYLKNLLETKYKWDSDYLIVGGNSKFSIQ